MAVEKLNRRHARVKLPKLGWVKFRMSRPLDGETIRSATLSKAGKQWFVSFLVDDGVEDTGRTCGHRRPRWGWTGVWWWPWPPATVSWPTGSSPRPANSGVRWCCSASCPAPLTVRPTAPRSGGNWQRYGPPSVTVVQDFCAKTAHRLAYTNDVVVLEDLQTRNMTRRAKPVEDRDNPGHYVSNGAASKSGLNRAILSKGWHRFEEALRSVSRYTGTQVIKVPAAFTSLRCSVCGHVDPKSRERQAAFRCTSCSRRQHADVNAAKNILAAGLAVTACREAAAPAGDAVTLTQEPAGNREELLLQPI